MTKKNLKIVGADGKTISSSPMPEGAPQALIDLIKSRGAAAVKDVAQQAAQVGAQRRQWSSSASSLVEKLRNR